MFPQDALKTFADQTKSYEEYQDDPVGFGEDILGETYTDDVKAMMESVRDYTVTIAKSGNSTGKTHGAARVATWFFKAFPDAQVYTLAAPPEDNLKKLLWGELGKIIETHPNLFAQHKKRSLHVEQDPKSFLTGVTIPMSGTDAERQAKVSGKHAPYLLFIVDEGDAVPEEIYKGIESCMSGGHIRLLIMFNPRAESGPVYRMERDGLANVVTLSAFNHPNVITGETVIPGGAVDRETTVRRINQWSRPLKEDERKSNESFEVPEFLVGCVARDQKGFEFPPLEAGFRKIMDPALSYMVLARYPAQAVNQLISREWTSAARARWDAYVAMWGEKHPKGSSGIMGMDCAEMGMDLNSVCFRYGGWVPKIKDEHLWNGLDMIENGDKAAEIYKTTPDVYVAGIEGNGVGVGVAPHMRRLHCNAHKVMVTESATTEEEIGKFGVIRDELLWKLMLWLRDDPGSMLPPDEKLLEELHILNYEVVKGKIKIMDSTTIREQLKRSADRLMSLAMTFADIQDETIPEPYTAPVKVSYAWA